MPSQADELLQRLTRFTVRVLKFVRTLARDPATEAVARQLARAATGSSGNYHSARRARSRAEFVARLGLGADEASEVEHWLGILKELLGSKDELESLLNEAAQLRAILVRSVMTARSNHRTRSLNP